MDTWEMIDKERASMADLADTLTPDQWNATTLCTAWKVRDAVAHLVEGATLTTAQTMGKALKHGFRINRMLEREAIKDGAKPTDELRSELRGAVGARNKPPGVKPEDMLLDTVVHQQDVRRPLGLTRTIPTETLTTVLDRAVQQKSGLMPGKKRSDGLKLRATDIGWEHGQGPEVNGTGEAILMAVSGRPAALADLSGPGVATLEARLRG